MSAGEWECGSCGAIIDRKVAEVGEDYHDPDEDCRAVRPFEAAPDASGVDDDPQQVWVLTITHRHGTNTMVCGTYQRARAELLAYVEEQWEAEMGNEPMPDDLDERLDAYFDPETWGGGYVESYSIEGTEVLP